MGFSIKKVFKGVKKLAGPIGTVVGGMVGGPTGAAIGGTIGGAISGSGSAKKASKSAVKAEQAGLQNQMLMYNQSRRDLAPQQYVGTQAINTIADMYGFNPWTTSTPDYTNINGATGAVGTEANAALNPYGAGTAKPNMNAFFASPDYNFRLGEGMKQIDRYNAANGRYLSGAQLKGINNYAQDAASQEYGNYMDRLFNIAGMGTTAGRQNASSANSVGANAMNAYSNIGQARASGYLGQASAWQNAADQIGTIFGNAAGGGSAGSTGSGGWGGLGSIRSPGWPGASNNSMSSIRSIIPNYNYFA